MKRSLAGMYALANRLGMRVPSSIASVLRAVLSCEVISTDVRSGCTGAQKLLHERVL